MMARYHVLLTREKAGQPWCPEFGDPDRDTVVYERQTYRDNGHKAANLKIVASNSKRQSCIDWIVGELNRAEFLKSDFHAAFNGSDAEWQAYSDKQNAKYRAKNPTN